MILKKCNLAVLPILALFIVMTIQPAAFAATLNTRWMAGTPPVCNGIIVGEEWGEAAYQTFNAYDVATHTISKQIYLWALNDGTHLYLYILWNDVNYDGNTDGVTIYFDENNDGNWSSPGMENGFIYQMNTTHWVWIDGICTTAVPGGVAPDPTSKDGGAGYSWSSTWYVVELFMPIASSDTEDLQPSAGATIGIAFLFTEDLGGAVTYYEYPNGALVNESVVTFQLTAAPSGIGTPLDLVYLLASLILVTVVVFRRKLRGPEDIKIN